MAESNHYNCIYRIVFPNGKCYVGQALDFEKRCKSRLRAYKVHLNGGISDNPKLFNAFDKYGINNCEYFILEENVENLNEREIYWIKYYDCVKNGYNVTMGGENVINPLTGRHVKYGCSKYGVPSDSSEYNKLRYKLNEKRRIQVAKNRKCWVEKHADEERKRLRQYKRLHKAYTKEDSEKRLKKSQFIEEGDKLMFGKTSNYINFGRCYRRWFGGGRTRSFNFVIPQVKDFGYLNEQECFLYKT